VALLGRDDLDAVGKSDTRDDLRQLICSFESAPGFRGGADELEHHQFCGLRQQGSFRPDRPVSHEHALERISGPQMDPMLGREVIKRQQIRPILIR
jgi:hypothetical protein